MRGRGNAAAAYRLGEIYVEGRGSQPLLIGRGLTYLEKGYRLGLPRSGLSYATEVERTGQTGWHRQRAIKVFKELIACGMPAAMTNLAYWQEKPGGPDLSEAYDPETLYERAALAGDFSAQNNYAIHLMQAYSWKKNHPHYSEKIRRMILGVAWGQLSASDSRSSVGKILDDIEKQFRKAGVWDDVLRKARELSAYVAPRARTTCQQPTLP